MKASTARGLRRAMLSLNLKLRGQATFFDIQYVDSEKAWFAWYVDEVKPEEVLGGDNGASA